MTNEPQEQQEQPKQLEQPMAKLEQADHLTPANSKDQELADRLQVRVTPFKPRNTDHDSISKK